MTLLQAKPLGSSFLPKRKYPKPEKMTAEDWAELIIEIAAHCMQEFKSIKQEGEIFSGNKFLDEVMKYSQSNHYQKVNWEQVTMPDYLTKRESTHLLLLNRFHWAIGQGSTKALFMTSEGIIFLCEATYRSGVLERQDKDMVYYLDKMVFTTVTDADKKVLGYALEQEKDFNKIGQECVGSLLKGLASSIDVLFTSRANKQAREVKARIVGDFIQQYQA